MALTIILKFYPVFLSIEDYEMHYGENSCVLVHDFNTNKSTIHIKQGCVLID
jgi:hypothetical protein